MNLDSNPDITQIDYIKQILEVCKSFELIQVTLMNEKFPVTGHVKHIP